MKRVVLLLSVLLLLTGIIFLQGCRNISDKEDQIDTELSVVRHIGYPIYDPIYIGIDKGFFEKRGVKVELTSMILGGPSAIQVIASGDAESGVSAIMAIINARGAGLPIIGIADLQSSRNESALEEFFVRTDSDIKTVAGLKGKKIAVNGLRASFHYTLLIALNSEGIEEDEVDFVILPFGEQAIALQEGRVDLIGLMQPHILKAEALFDTRLLFDALDVFGEKQFSLVCINKVWADNNEDTARAYVSGIADSIAWIIENQDEAKDIISKYTKIEKEYVADYFYQENGKVNIEDCEFWLEYMKGRGETAADWLEVEDFATNKYNDREE